ncbi:MFS transporter [Telmatospirillum siberiense]|uniref:MFS transporter n=1 Tax=Telmatospirillum siberiense TaxID=382514 RepID=A0A2N3PXP0_9PROT|nr:MFS transporter [Telmatospirillum siberiense]PKU25176.1 MFS transporter [Telmatospirillum siberiense]
MESLAVRVRENAPFHGRSGLLLGLVITAGILNYADRQIIAVLKPMLEQDLGWSDNDYGRLTATFQFAAAVAFPFVGWIVDRIGAKWANPVAVASWSLAAMAHGFAFTSGQFLAARVALGATEAMGTPTAIKTLALLFDARGRAMALGIMNGAASLGAIATPLIIPFLALAVGWRATFLLTGACGLVWALAWLPLAGRKRWSPQEEDGESARQVPWKPILTDRRTWAIGGAKALSDQAWWFLLFWTPDFLHRTFHLDLGELALPIASIYLMAAIGSLAGGGISTYLLQAGIHPESVRKRAMLAAAVMVTPIPFVLLTGEVWAAVAFLGLALAAHQAFSVNLFALITDVIPARRVGRVTSIGALCGNLSGMLVLQTAGWILGNGGGYLPLFLMTAGAYLLASLWIHWLLPNRLPAPAVEAVA